MSESNDRHTIFAAAYREKLVEAVNRNHENYMFSSDDVEGIAKVADKMTRALAEGRANLGPAGKAAARKLGIKPTQGAIKIYLNGG